MKNSVKRIVSLLLCALMIVGNMAGMGVAVKAETVDNTYGGTKSKVTDPSTLNNWEKTFTPISTEHAGDIWTDKSVFSTANDYVNATDESDDSLATKLALQDTNNFLVALSVMASSKGVEGYDTLPSDTMLVLDLSASMINNQAVAPMINAANDAIKRLQELNANNRVGVVAYSGKSTTGASETSTAQVILPLGRYTAGANGKYLESSWRSDGENRQGIKVANGVTGTFPKGINGNLFSTSNSKTASGGTYIQNGLYQAWGQFSALDASETVVKSGLQMGTVRKPIFVLLSDGAATAAATSYKDIGTSNVGDGSASYATEGLAFLTQLTATYVHDLAKQKYGTDPLFYTLGLKVSSSGDRTVGSAAESVLAPKQFTLTDKYWETFLKLENATNKNMQVLIRNASQGNPAGYAEVKYSAPVYEKSGWTEDYVDEYFPASNTQGLLNAFTSIVDHIIIQSLYYPTHVDEGEDINEDGFVHFEDYIGTNMEVKAIKGIQLGSELYDGHTLAKMIYEGGMGTVANPTDVGNALVWSVQKRLGITDVDVARQLIGKAWQHGQISYAPATGAYSNYIGWYANEDGKYVDFWDGNEDTAVANKPDNAVFAIKSYLYYDAVGEGHRKTDMMYATIQVRTNVADCTKDGSNQGDIRVIGQLPASLIPLYEYKIEVNNANPLDPKSMTVTENIVPSRLIYEVGVKDEIDSLNPPANLTKENGQYVFYTNYWHNVPDSGYDFMKNKNTISYFEPSDENERYYYNADMPVYTDTNGTKYTGTTAPASGGTYYRTYILYTMNNGTVSAETVYELIPQKVLEAHSAEKPVFEQKDDGTWVVKMGTVYRYVSDPAVQKDPNATGTLLYSEAMFYHDPQAGYNKLGGKYHLDAYLGNNGKLLIDPYEGIKLSKSVDDTITDLSKDYSFTITANDNTFAETCALVKESAAGRQPGKTIEFTNGVATLTLKAGETAYIIGSAMAGKTFTVTEEAGTDYEVGSVNSDKNADQAVITVAQNTIHPVAFVNTKLVNGEVIITKNVVSTHEEHEAKDFAFTVTVDAANSTLAEGALITAVRSDGETFTATLNENKQAEIKTPLKHGQTLTLDDLPAGVVVRAAEENYSADGFMTGMEPAEGSQTVVAGQTKYIEFTNTYAASATDAKNVTVNGVKTLRGTAWSGNFEFALQRLDGNSWTKVSEQTVAYSNETGNKSFAFSLAGETYSTPGVYSYRVVEVTGDAPGVVYDPIPAYFDVTVTDNLNGELYISDVKAGNDAKVTPKVEEGQTTGWEVEVDFVNSYNVTGEVTATLIIDKTVNSGNYGVTIPASGFSFALYEADNDYNIIEGKEPKTSAPTNATGDTLFNLTYNSVGEYYYVLKEIIPEEADESNNYTVNGITYSTEAYHVYVNVEDDSNAEHVIMMTVYDAEDNVIWTSVQQNQPSTTADEGDETTGGNETTDETTPTTGEGEGSTGEGTPTAGEGTPTTGEGTPTTGEGTPTTGEGTPTTGEGTPTTGGGTTTTGEGTPTIGEGTPTTGEGTSTTGEGDDTTGNNGIDGQNLSDGADEGADEQNKQRATDNTTVVFTDTAVMSDPLTFTNKFTPTPVTTSFKVSKVLTGRDMEDNEFSLALYETDSNFTVAADATPIQTLPVTAQQNGVASVLNFSELSYDAVGTHYYVVKEVIPADADKLGGVTYDTSEYHVTVNVTGDNTTGDLHVTKTATKDGHVVYTAVFNNTYKAAPVQATIRGEKNLSGNIRKLQANMFHFELKDASGNVVETVGNGIPNFDGTNADVVFAPLTFDAPGTYKYTVSEVRPYGAVDIGNNQYKHNGVVYDANAYDVTVVVTDDGNGELTAQVNYPADNKFTFNNAYQVEPTQITLSGVKHLSGDALKNRTFNFELYKAHYADQNNPYVQDALLKTVTQDSNTGAFIFTPDQVPELKFSAIGAYRFIIKEKVSDEDPLVDYDESVYLVEVVVTDGGNGTLKATTNYTKVDELGAQSSVTAVEFTNHVKPEPVMVELSGDKHYNKEITENFTFDLYQAMMVDNVITAVGEPVLTEKLTVDAANNKTGTFTFKELVETDDKGNVVSQSEYLTFHEPGTRYFVIKETIPAEANSTNGYTADNITYSTKEYKIEVKVELVIDATGRETLQATVMVDGEKDGDITFINTHHAHSDGVDLTAKKTLEGKHLHETDVHNHGGFQFALYEATVDADNKVTKGDKLQTVYNDGSSVYFNEITYTNSANATYYYVIEEVIPAGATDNKFKGVTYDTAKYLAKVEVKYNNGTLTVDAPVYYAINTANANGAMVGTIGAAATMPEFKNHYTTDPIDLVVEGTLGGKKTLMEGPALTAGQFTFKLYAADEYWNPVGTDALTATNDAHGNFVFSNKLAGSTNYILNKAPFVVDKAGTYRFLMVEEEGTDANIRYDAAQYRIEVEVEDKGDGTLAVKKTSYFKATVVDGTLIEGEADQNGVKFVNIYVPDEIKITIEGEKILTDYKGNKVALGDKVFRFEIYETGANYAVAEGTLPVASTANDENGDFAFELPIGQAGNKYYVIRESDESAYADINNDPTEFHVMVQVSLGADGKLSASKPVIKVGDKEHELQFVNTYDRPEPAKLMVELDVQKDLVNQNAYGKDLSGFKFELVNAENKVVDTAESDAKGKTTLYAAEFAMSDVGKTFTYTVREVNTGISSMVYSTHQYKVEITIGYDSESNSLFATVKKDGVALQKGETFMFTNIYNPPYYPNYPDEPERDPDRPSSPKTGEESSWPWIMMLSIGIMGLAVTTACLFAKPRKARR